MKRLILLLVVCLSIIGCGNNKIDRSEDLSRHPNLHRIDDYTIYDDRTEIVYYYYHSYYNSAMTPMFATDGSAMTKEEYLKLK